MSLGLLCGTLIGLGLFTQKTAEVNKAMQAVGTYFDPRVRLGWALAGAGAAVASKAFGVDKKFESRFGVPVGRAVQSAGPGLQLLAAGLDMIGGR